MSTAHSVIVWAEPRWRATLVSRAVDETITTPQGVAADGSAHANITFRSRRFLPRPLQRTSAQDQESVVDPGLGDESSYVVSTWPNLYSSAHSKWFRMGPQDLAGGVQLGDVADGSQHIVLVWPRLWRSRPPILSDTTHDVAPDEDNWNISLFQTKHWAYRYTTPWRQILHNRPIAADDDGPAPPVQPDTEQRWQAGRHRKAQYARWRPLYWGTAQDDSSEASSRAGFIGGGISIGGSQMIG